MGKPLDTPPIKLSTAASPRVDPLCSADDARASVATDALKALARALARQAARDAFSTAAKGNAEENAAQRTKPNVAR